MTTTLVIGLDGEGSGDRALAYGKRLAGLIGDCTLLVTYVIEWLSIIFVRGFMFCKYLRPLTVRTSYCFFHNILLCYYYLYDMRLSLSSLFLFYFLLDINFVVLYRY